MKLLCLCMLLFAFAGSIQAEKVKVEYNNKDDFSKYKTYMWMKQGATDYPFVAMDIRGEVDKQLQARGLSNVTTSPDLMVNAYGGMDGGMNVSFDHDIYAMPGLDGPIWWADGSPLIAGNSTAVFVDKGTLVIDIVDRKLKKLKWRGSAKQNLDPEEVEKSLEIIEKSIIEMFRKYPVHQ